MTILKVLEWPHEVLETKCSEVTVFDEKLKTFVQDMFETMEESRGIGLAANQVNSLQRVLIISIPYSRVDEEENIKKADWHDKPWVFINPKIVAHSQNKIKYAEGCLSFPEVYDYVPRFEKVTVEAQDAEGKTFQVEADDLFSVALQHEIDHLDGIVFFRRMSRLKASAIVKKMRKRALSHDQESDIG